VTNNSEHRKDGTLTPIDPKTGKPGKPISVDDPYNMYFMPDGSEAIVVAEAHERLDFRDPHTMALHSSLAVPGCKGINHADFSHRRQLRDLHLRIYRRAGQDRPGASQGRGPAQAGEKGLWRHAAGHPHCRRTAASFTLLT
jgi:hypothetical protein